MKKSLKFSLLALVMAGAVACSDDDNEDNQNEPPSNAELIKGEWTGVEAESYTYNSTDTTVEVTSQSFVWTFNEDDTFTRVEDEDTTNGTYVLDGTMLTITQDAEDTEYEVTTLDESNLTLNREEQIDSVQFSVESRSFEKM